MTEDNKTRAARRGDWKTEPMPDQRETFVLHRSFSDEEMAALRRGNVPQAMEDKWFWFMEGSTLWAHRSWTGYCIYRIDFKESSDHLVTVNRDPQQYKCTSIEEDVDSLNKLLDWWTRTPYDHYDEWLSETYDALERSEKVSADQGSRESAEKSITKRAYPEEAEKLSELVRIVWSEHSTEELTGILKNYMDSDDSAVFAELVDGEYAGVALCCLRHDYVEGCETSPVGYLEGVSVREEYRRRGIAEKLVSECEQWAREKGCTEFASDCALTNTASLNFHLGIGFKEENRIICFKKEL